MDGFCPVQIYEQNRWVRGDPHYGVIHRGRTYLFRNPDEAKRFYADPDKYAPMLSGQDVVLAVDQGLSVPGTWKIGVRYAGHIYLFSAEASCQQFYKDPERYARAVQAVMDTAQRAVPAANASSVSSPPSSSRAWDGRY
jgi:protein disulfide-isomerase